MNKIIFSLLLVFLTSTNLVYADATSTSNIDIEQVEVILDNSSTTEDNLEAGTSTEPQATSTVDNPIDIDEVKIYIKNGSEIIFEGVIEINDEEIEIIDNTNTSHYIENNNVLAALNSVDIESDSFSVSDLQYYSSFDSFLLNCIDTGLDSLCYEWQYVVNDSYPFVGIDGYKLEDGDEIYFYFGQPRRISIPNNTYANIEFSVDSEEYDYVDNAWSSLSDYTVGIFQDDPENPWTQIVFATSTIDETGKSFFTLEKEGDYKIGFEEDYYYPSYDLVISSSSTATDSNSTTTDSGNTNSGGGVPSSNSFDIESAIGFLLESQDSDGGFGPDLYSDWAAVAFSSVDESNNSLKSNVENSSVSSDLYEKLRKSMALLALDLDPQDDFEENLIEEILDEFDGEQFGEESFFNDDIFTLIVLYNLGFDEDDEEISKTIDFILSNQSSSGAFQGVDLTAAAIQALVEFEDYPGVSGALSEAEEYLKNQQNSDGSWGDVYSTSWVMMAMSALKYDFDEWKGDPLQYLGDEQDSDGGLLKDESEGNRIWSTSYAIVAASEKTWIEILNDFSFNKPEESNSNLSGGSARSNSEIEQVGEVLGDTSEEITAAQLITENLDKILLFLDKNKQDKEVDFQSNQVSIPINFEDIELIEVKEEIKDYLNNEYDSFEKKALVKDSRQTAAAINSIDFQRFIYLILAIVALIISVIMFKRK